MTLVNALKAYARSLDIAACGICDLSELTRGKAALLKQIEVYPANDLAFLQHDPGKRADPKTLLTDGQRAIVIAVCYQHPNEKDIPIGAEEGKIARYARSKDYHLVLRDKLQKIAEWIHTHVDPKATHRICVDTSPLLERELAMRAGVGFIGKNTMLITPKVGSYTVLGVLLTSAELPCDVPENERCGRCTRCIDACPTQALDAQGYRMDPTRCLSYLTIEKSGSLFDERFDANYDQIQTEQWIFGCDRCQEVCPFQYAHRSADLPVDVDLKSKPENASISLAKLLNLRSGDYRRLVKDRALRRISRPQFARNAALAAANIADPTPDLRQSLLDAQTRFLERTEVIETIHYAKKPRRSADLSDQTGAYKNDR